MLRALFIVTLSLVQTEVFAGTHFLLVNGGESEERNHIRYYNEVRRAYEVLEFLNLSRRVISSNGEWGSPSFSEDAKLSKYSLNPQNSSLSYQEGFPPLHGSARSTSDLMSALSSFPYKAGDKFVIYFVGHGRSAKGWRSPIDSSYAFWKRPHTRWSDILRGLQTWARNNDVMIKLITKASFGGGIHQLHQVGDRVCAFSTTTSFVTNNSGSHTESLFNIILWDKFLASKGKVGLAKLSLDSSFEDPSNQNLGLLSSMDFLDWTEETGQHDYTQQGTIKLFWTSFRGEATVGQLLEQPYGRVQFLEWQYPSVPAVDEFLETFSYRDSSEVPFSNLKERWAAMQKEYSSYIESFSSEDREVLKSSYLTEIMTRSKGEMKITLNKISSLINRERKLHAEIEGKRISYRRGKKIKERRELRQQIQAYFNREKEEFRLMFRNIHNIKQVNLALQTALSLNNLERRKWLNLVRCESIPFL